MEAVGINIEEDESSGDEAEDLVESLHYENFIPEKPDTAINRNCNRTVSVKASKTIPVGVENSTSTTRSCNPQSNPLRQNTVKQIVIPQKGFPKKMISPAKTQGNIQDTDSKATTSLTMDCQPQLKNVTSKRISPQEAVPRKTASQSQPYPGNLQILKPNAASPDSVPNQVYTPLDPLKGVQIEGITKFYESRGSATQPRRYMCEYCNFAFIQQSSLTRHRKIKHTG